MALTLNKQEFFWRRQGPVVVVVMDGVGLGTHIPGIDLIFRPWPQRA